MGTALQPPDPRGSPHIWFSSTATAPGSPQTPCPSQGLEQTRQAGKPVWLSSYQGCSQASKEKFCDTKCQLGWHIGNVFTWVLCFDSFGTENKTKTCGSLTKSMGPRSVWDFAVEGLGWSSWQHLSPKCVGVFFFLRKRVCACLENHFEPMHLRHN